MSPRRPSPPSLRLDSTLHPPHAWDVKLEHPLIKLPVSLCADTLAAEVRALPADAWVAHPQKFEGNEYVPLVTPAGLMTNEFAGPMGPTPFLRQCPYIMEIMAALDCVWGRSRLMGLGPGGSVPEHIDINYYWRTHVRVHIPIITNPDVDFTCGGQTVSMVAGECWLVDTFQSHHVENRGTEQRIHLVLDTVGGERLWDLVCAATQTGEPPEPAFVEVGRSTGTPIRMEQLNYPRIMSPWEMRTHVEELLALAPEAPPLDMVRGRLDRLIAGWTAVWTEHGDSGAGLPAYRALLDSARQGLDRIGGHAIMLPNKRSLYHVIQGFIFENAVESERVRQSKAAVQGTRARLAS
jgi:hypothetical protein